MLSPKAPSPRLVMLLDDVCLPTSGTLGAKQKGEHPISFYITPLWKLTSLWLKDPLQGQQHPGNAGTCPFAEGARQQWALIRA